MNRKGTWQQTFIYISAGFGVLFALSWAALIFDRFADTIKEFVEKRKK